jgi:mannose-1-phosphate guanylyltransferase
MKRPPKPRQKIYDLYWYFASERQHMFEKRSAGLPAPWTDDPILQTYKFCNVFRAADRVSQYMIRDVCYHNEPCTPADRLFQVVAFRTFSKIETWQAVHEFLGRYPTLQNLADSSFTKAIEHAMTKNGTIYTAAFILAPGAVYGQPRKYLNHVELFRYMFLTDNLAAKLQATKSLREVYDLLHSYPLMGDFMSYQTAIDLNYSDLINFSENDFVQPGPVALLWSDHLMDNVPHFTDSLKTAEKICTDDPKKVVLISEKSRFPNNSLGWINFGKKNADGSYKFVGFKYKPDYAKCEEMFESGEWDWNPGYMVYDVDHALSLFKTFVPEVYDGLMKIYDAIGTVREGHVTSEVYPNIPKIHHDHVVAENLTSKDAVVVRSNMGWSDPGTLYALKEALVKKEADNLEMGNVRTMTTTDTMVINEEPGKLVATIGLDGMVVVNTHDVLIVVPKTEILKVTDLVQKLAEDHKTEKFT